MTKNRKNGIAKRPKEQLCMNISTPNRDSSSKTTTEPIGQKFSKSQREEMRRNSNVETTNNCALQF
jgi:hypothetical protein